MDQEPYPNQEDGCTIGLDGSRYQLMDVLGGEVEWDPWRMLRMSRDAGEMEKELKLALENGDLWRWRVELVLWYGRWLEEMEEKDSEVCYQIKVEEVECSQQLCFYITIQE